MKMQRCVALTMVATIAVLAEGRSARADSAGDKVVAAMDAAMNRAKSHRFEYDITNKEVGKDERTMGMKVLIKGEKRLSEFLAPADMKGTKVLILSPTQMYVFLPAFGKVRRIASHTKDQGFMGLTFSQDDMATQSFGGDYEGTILNETPAAWQLLLTPRHGKETSYTKIEVTVGKDHTLPSELRYFNSEGKNIKTETRTGYTCDAEVCTPSELKMVDNTKGSWSRFARKSWKANEPLADDVFSQRSLGE